jgi:alcohol oxidase
VHQNLHLAVNTKVDKVIIEGGRAVGVRTVPTKPLSPSENHSRTFKARKQIIVSGGTLSSPLILQRSGIGNPEKLRKAGVKPIVDLPGVGLNFQDHYLVSVSLFLLTMPMLYSDTLCTYVPTLYQCHFLAASFATPC